MNVNSTITSPQMFFNWGYWNARSDFENSRENKWLHNEHPEPVYRTGYLVGWGEAARGVVTESSEEAWSYALLWGDVVL